MTESNNDIDLSILAKKNRKNAICDLHLFVPTMLEDVQHDVIADNNGEVLYYGKSYFDEYTKSIIEFNPDYYSHFHMVINRDGTLWYEANRYLLNMVLDDTAAYESQRVSKQTIKEHATALQYYKWFCDSKDRELVENKRITLEQSQNTPFWKVAKRPTSRPNIAYKRYLIEKIENGKLAVNTVKKYLTPITEFYKFIINEYGSEYLDLGKNVKMPGRDTDHLIPTDYGNKVVIGNEANYIPYANNQNDGYIRDGGNTKPLTIQQQEILFKIIHDRNQPEIVISHIFAMETAARLGTIFTLRLRHFLKSLPYDNSSKSLEICSKENDIYKNDQIYTIKVGGTQLVDTKGLDREYKLKVPGWLMRNVQRYCLSERAIHRRENINFTQINLLDEYVFITHKYNPYYCSKSDPNKAKYHILPTGQALRTYKSDHITPYINFEYKFHFLRATALWNMLQGLLKSGLSDSDALDQVRDFAGHKSKTTTEGYLKWKPNEEVRYKAFDDHAKKLYGWAKDYIVIDEVEEYKEDKQEQAEKKPSRKKTTLEELIAENTRLKEENECLRNDKND